ncbi:uncharacterized protein MKK02DRAFT_30834 [Dioszegia hungarica]|uniref:Uncharacterized protein n=1 Tax=Dioszegia hungarica TaxID=4972 RepID=A0AA38H1A8_9TREE|nr:uncharacterized protein MKK02DRAFT_30834 [Dioszegia hungarica]KAI9631837.1 hypothetical protein MKK02DRAFT_30834 [Dioszegia hungarica]
MGHLNLSVPASSRLSNTSKTPSSRVHLSPAAPTMSSGNERFRTYRPNEHDPSPPQRRADLTPLDRSTDGLAPSAQSTSPTADPDDRLCDCLTPSSGNERPPAHHPSEIDHRLPPPRGTPNAPDPLPLAGRTLNTPIDLERVQLITPRPASRFAQRQSTARGPIRPKPLSIQLVWFSPPADFHQARRSERATSGNTSRSGNGNNALTYRTYENDPLPPFFQVRDSFSTSGTRLLDLDPVPALALASRSNPRPGLSSPLPRSVQPSASTLRHSDKIHGYSLGYPAQRPPRPLPGAGLVFLGLFSDPLVPRTTDLASTRHTLGFCRGLSDLHPVVHYRRGIGYPHSASRPPASASWRGDRSSSVFFGLAYPAGLDPAGQKLGLSSGIYDTPAAASCRGIGLFRLHLSGRTPPPDLRSACSAYGTPDPRVHLLVHGRSFWVSLVQPGPYSARPAIGVFLGPLGSCVALLAQHRLASVSLVQLRSHVTRPAFGIVYGYPIPATSYGRRIGRSSLPVSLLVFPVPHVRLLARYRSHAPALGPSLASAPPADTGLLDPLGSRRALSPLRGILPLDALGISP